MKAINDKIACPVLRKIYATLLGEWYDHDQHFDSPLLDQLRQIEEAHNGYVVWCRATWEIGTKFN